MKIPFVPLTSEQTRDLLQRVHHHDYECVPFLVLQLLVDLTGTEAAATQWRHLDVYKLTLWIPSRGVKIPVARAAVSWILLYHFGDEKPQDPISTLPPKIWTSRFRRIVPECPVSHLRRSYEFYRQIEKLSPDKSHRRAHLKHRLEILRLLFVGPSNFQPPIKAPIRRGLISLPATPSPMTVTGLDLI